MGYCKASCGNLNFRLKNKKKNRRSWYQNWINSEKHPQVTHETYKRLKLQLSNKKTEVQREDRNWEIPEWERRKVPYKMELWIREKRLK